MRPPRRRDAAEALALALMEGLAQPSEAARWADAEILRSPVSEPSLVDLSLGERDDPQTMANRLREIPGAPDDEAVLRLYLAIAAKRLASGVLPKHRFADWLWLRGSKDPLLARIVPELESLYGTSEGVLEGYASEAELDAELHDALAPLALPPGLLPPIL